MSYRVIVSLLLSVFVMDAYAKSEISKALASDVSHVVKHGSALLHDAEEKGKAAFQEGEDAFEHSAIGQFLEKEFDKIKIFIKQEDQKMTSKIEDAIVAKVKQIMTQVKVELEAYMKDQLEDQLKQIADLILNPAKGVKVASGAVGDVGRDLGQGVSDVASSVGGAVSHLL